MRWPATGKPPVIKDVARLAGVSVPTVSRVLTGTTRVTDEKRERVLRAIDQLNFRPSAEARALVARAPRLVAILAGDTSRYGYAETIRGIEESARTSSMVVTITVIESADPDDVQRAIELIANQPLAGIVVLKFDPPGDEALLHVPGGVPVIALAGARDRSTTQVVLAEADGADEMVTHLLDLGHATVHHVRVPHPRREDRRTVGWRRALKRAGITPPPVLDATWEPESGRLIGAELAQRDDVTAVFCGNDEIAMGVMRGLADSGLRVPDDVSVVGFDDHPLASMWVPSLTTVRQDFAALGSRAFGLLEELIAGSAKVRFASLRTETILRESAGPPRRR